jgi:hypothetical protein
VIKIIDAHFVIPADQLVAAFETVMTYYYDVRDHPFFEDAFPKKLAEASDLKSFLDELGYLLGIDSDGEADYLDTYGEVNYRGDEYLFAALAPFVQPGCYVELQIGASFYRWEFDGTYLFEFKGDIYYKDHMIVSPQDFTKVNLNEDDLDDIRLPEFDDEDALA